MNSRLDCLNKYSSNKRYFHFLLSKISHYAQKVENPINYLELNINNLKKNYPNKIQFIVWDSDGKIINQLSDRINVSYVLKKLYQSLKEVTSKVSLDYSFRISNLDSIKNNYNIFRTFFGQVYISENLKLPLSRGFDAGPFLTGLGHGLTYAWYSINDKISMMCFLSDELLSEFSGLEKISEKLNNTDNTYITGYSIHRNYTEPLTPFPKNYYSDIQMALSSFLNSGNNIYENDRALVKMSMPESSIIIFSFLPKTDSKWNYVFNRNLCFYILLSLLLFVYALWGVYYFYKRNFFSIRWKLSALFLFANLAPISIIGFIANDYLDSQRLSIKNEIIRDLEKSVRELETRYRSLIDDYGLRLNSTFAEVSKKVGNNVIEQPEIERLKKLYDEFNASELYIVASNSQMIGYKRDENKAKQRISYITKLGKSILDYANDKSKNTSNNDTNATKQIDTEYLKVFLDNVGLVSDFNIGDMARIYYSFIFGDRVNYNKNYVFIMFWDREYLQNLFLRETYNTLYKNFPDAHFYIKSNLINNSYGNKELDKVINSVLQSNSRIDKKVSGITYLSNKKYIYVCVNGTVLNDWVLVAAYPEERINSTIRFIVFQIIGGVFLSILLTFIIIHILSLHFLNPIRSLGDATLAIEQRNFAYRIPVADLDEFGHLEEVFNRVLEGLDDFEIAKIVQESLFPSDKLLLPSFNVFGKSYVTTTLGGDYYDYFKINEKNLGIVIGNVSVKGIPAGLIMSMAKSVILSSSEEIKLNPAKLTKKLNKMFLSIEGKSLNHVMTFQYFVMDINTGRLVFANAGHCLPVVVDTNTNITKCVKYLSPALGESIDSEYDNYEFNLLEKQSLILYNDTLQKALNSSSGKLDNEGFYESLKDSYDNDSEKYYNNIFDLINNSSSPDLSDITLIIVNRE
ncbi:MAG: SpoIIE family protein phosphatase [Candidatus Riflebacteria bacterium]|nr:SpoIIE family protein phosphatase [Candidatus Riflebacteria bacterium]